MNKSTKTIISLTLLLILTTLITLQMAMGFIGETSIRRNGNEVDTNDATTRLTPLLQAMHGRRLA